MFKLNPQLAADTIKLGDLPLCTVLLMNEQQFPWIILVPRRSRANEIYQLNNADQTQLQNESQGIAKLMMNHFNGDKFNTAALGNVVSQLHIHHIVRFHDDVAWPKPVWGNIENQPYSAEQRTNICGQLKSLISNSLAGFAAC